MQMINFFDSGKGFPLVFYMVIVNQTKFGKTSVANFRMNSESFVLTCPGLAKAHCLRIIFLWRK
jgi:hypothetical protein